MRLELQSVEMKNFLSYGNSPQRLDFVEGINLIIGKNLGSGRSNGSGKSSLIETVPFSWFGKLSRPVKKDQIVNWVNRKHCEVKTTFKKGDTTYTILRAIKPDKLEIYENDRLIPIPSNVRAYQEALENEILGMDYNTFMYLFYTNLNTNTPLLKMTTPQKRSFLEKLFSLDTYTELNNLSNEKIKSLDEKIFKLNVTVEQNDKTMDDLKSQNSSLRLKIIDIKPWVDDLQKLNDEYDTLKKDIPDDIDDVIVEVSEEIIKLESESKTLQDDINIITNELVKLESDNKSRSSKIDDIKRRKEEREQKLSSLKEELLRLDAEIKESPDEYESKIELLDNSISNNITLKNNISIEIMKYETKKKDKEDTYNSLKDGMCPTCKREISSETLDDEYIKDIELYKIEIEKQNVKKQELVLSIEADTKDKDDTKFKLKKLNEKMKKKSDLLSSYKTLSEIKIPSVTEDLEQISSNKEKINEFTEERKVVIIKLKDISSRIIEYKDKHSNLISNVDTLEDLSNKIKSLESEIKIRKDNRTDINNIIEANLEKIKSLESESKTHKISINKLKELVDYLSYLKVLCKDENVKQYAISSNMPYLIQQTNHYLSKAGSIHYVKFNKWLEEEIHGAGVFDASYGNLSGGESRSIDLAIQFAFLDVGKLKTGIFPDVLFLDEILDSSIDSGGLSNILRIIKTKQDEDKSKVFIITHRTEISDVDVDNTYIINKKDGFSIVEKNEL